MVCLSCGSSYTPSLMSMTKPYSTRSKCLFLANLASEAERHEDVVAQIKAIINLYNARLSIDERNLLSIAFKNITNMLRNSWRVIDNHEKFPVNDRHLALLRSQREKVERELSAVCGDIVSLLEKHLIPSARPGEETVFYSKMKGDYYRYLADFAHKRERYHYGELSLNAYKMAYQHALGSLDPLHPTRLGLALNFAVFYHDIRKSPERACHLAKSAFDEAVISFTLTDLNVDQGVKDSVTILQLLKDDLILWSTEMQSD